ncbi:MAG TPA: hypothetical protein VGJ89_01365 [Geothrix sp.]
MIKPIYRWIFLFLFDPFILAPVLAFAWSRIRGGFSRPHWMGRFLTVQIIDLVQGAIFIALALSHRNNQWFRHLSQPVVFAGMLWVLVKTSPPSPRRLGLYWACAATGLLAAAAGVYVNGLFLRNALFTTTQCLIYIGLGVYELRRLALRDDDENLAAMPEFWLNSAILIYGSTTLIFNASSNHFLRVLPPHLLPLPWLVHGLVIVFYEIALAKVFLCRKPASS